MRLLSFTRTVHNHFIIPIAEEDKKELQYGINRLNLSRAILTSTTFILLELLMLLMSFLLKDNFPEDQLDWCYGIMYVLMLIIMSFFLFFFLQFQKKTSGNEKRIQVTGILFSIFILTYCAGISIVDQFSSGQIIVYTVAILAVAVAPLFHPWELPLVYGPPHVLFLLILILSRQTIGHTFANCMNSTTVVIIACVISWMRYQNRLLDFQNKKLIQNKNKDLEELNQKLALTNQQLEVANRKLEKLTQTDSLTGILNRTAFDYAAEIEWKRCRYLKQSMSLIMIDIDYFKAFNDHYGHQAGDECLRRVAVSLSGCTRSDTELVTRYGGEEFAVILPDADQEKAYAIAEWMRSSIEELRIPHEYSSISDYVTISLGIFTLSPADPISLYDSITAADKALYRAKNDKRNQTVVA